VRKKTETVQNVPTLPRTSSQNVPFPETVVYWTHPASGPMTTTTSIGL
jgi:hypothetical protein